MNVYPAIHQVNYFFRPFETLACASQALGGPARNKLFINQIRRAAAQGESLPDATGNALFLGKTALLPPKGTNIVTYLALTNTKGGHLDH